MIHICELTEPVGYVMGYPHHQGDVPNVRLSTLQSAIWAAERRCSDLVAECAMAAHTLGFDDALARAEMALYRWIYLAAEEVEAHGVPAEDIAP